MTILTCGVSLCVSRVPPVGNMRVMFTFHVSSTVMLLSVIQNVQLHGRILSISHTVPASLCQLVM